MTHLTYALLEVSGIILCFIVAPYAIVGVQVLFDALMDD